MLVCRVAFRVLTLFMPHAICKFPRYFLALCICLSWVQPLHLHAQQASVATVEATVLVAGTYLFKGTTIWQQPDGTTLHGTVKLHLFVTLQADGSPDVETTADLTFLNPYDSSPFTYEFVGKMNADKVGSLQASAVSVSSGGSTSVAIPALEVTKLPIMLNQKLTAVSGGTLAPNGTQLTFRTTFRKLFTP